jgi:hypothetical protein
MKSAGRSTYDLAVPRLPVWAAERVRELSAERADALVRAGVTVLGDPDSLRVVDPGPGAGDSPHVETVAIDTVVRAVEGAVTADTATLAKVAPPRRKARPRAARPTLEDASTRELVGLLRGRVAARASRRLRGGGR